MTRQVIAILVAAVLALPFAGVMGAHEDFRVIGTLTRHDEWKIEVKNADSKTVSIRLDKQTRVTRDKKTIDVSELRVGQSLVVDAYGDSEADLLALNIRIVPPITRRR